MTIENAIAKRRQREQKQLESEFNKHKENTEMDEEIIPTDVFVKENMQMLAPVWNYSNHSLEG